MFDPGIIVREVKVKKPESVRLEINGLLKYFYLGDNHIEIDY